MNLGDGDFEGGGGGASLTATLIMDSCKKTDKKREMKSPHTVLLVLAHS